MTEDKKRRNSGDTLMPRTSLTFRRNGQIVELRPIGHHAFLFQDDNLVVKLPFKNGIEAREYLARRWNCAFDQIECDLPTRDGVLAYQLPICLYFAGTPFRGFYTEDGDKEAREQIFSPGWEYDRELGEYLPRWTRIYGAEHHVPLCVPWASRFMARLDEAGIAYDRRDENGIAILNLDTGTSCAIRQGEFRRVGARLMMASWNETLLGDPCSWYNVIRCRQIFEEVKNWERIDRWNDFGWWQGSDVISLKWSHYLAEMQRLPSHHERMSPPPGFDVAWFTPDEDLRPRGFNTDWLLVRLPESDTGEGKIRCPQKYRGQLIGKGGENIRNLAERNGFLRLEVVDVDRPFRA